MIEKKAINVITPDGVVKIGVRIVGGDAADLRGKYSESFVNEMARQLTPIIESAASVRGLADSSLSLALIFAPNTFMEHISDNVTYRRLLLLDGVSTPRDFWVRWTRLDGAVAYPMWAEVSGDNILFELGEDVFQKIREKEYRYLLAKESGEYHDAMSRKNVTEWRDLIKRAVRRGELKKVEAVIELAPETVELEARLAGVLGRELPEKESEPVAFAPADEEFERAMQKAREVAEGLSVADEPLFELDPVDKTISELFDDADDAEEIEEIPEEIEEEYDEQAELDEITRMALEALQFSKANAEAPEEEPEETDEPTEPVFSEDIFEIGVMDEPEEEAEPEIEEEPEVEEPEAEEPEIEEAPEASEPEKISEEEETVSEEPVVEQTPVVEEAPEEPNLEEIAAEVYASADRIRAEIEAKIRLEFENKARMKAEAELAELRREQERMKQENDKMRIQAQQEQERLRQEYEALREQSRRAQAVREAQEAVRRAEEEKLRERIEAQLRAEAREKERLAEAARLAIAEQHRLQAEAERVARARQEELRAEEERRRLEEAQAQLEAARQAEIERVRREAEEQRLAAQKALPVMGDGKYTYTSKTVKFIFRRSVDPNITTRIYEIIKATLEYYGKDKIYLKIKASVPDAQTVCLEFVQIPIEEMQLLGNIIKILGNSGLGIAKAIIE